MTKANRDTVIVLVVLLWGSFAILHFAWTGDSTLLAFLSGGAAGVGIDRLM